MLANIFFALALSIDGLGMGLSYGLRKIRLTFFPLLIICISSGLAMLFSMSCGGILASFFTERVASVIGAVLLIIVGLWLVVQNFCLTFVRSNANCTEEERVELVLAILKEPVRADLNNSGEIDVHEALFLGVALAMDAMGAGFGAALAGYSLFWTPILVAVVEFLMIDCGFLLGTLFPFSELNKAFTYVPGAIIIALGLLRLFW